MTPTHSTQANVDPTPSSTSQDDTPSTSGRSTFAPEDWEHLEARGLIALAAHIFFIRTIDDVLDRIDKLLNIYQPPKSGKIRIQRWRRSKGGESVVAPMGVKWIQDRWTLRWRGVVVSTFKLSRSAKSSRDFHDHHQRVQNYLAAAQSALQLRSAAVTRVETCRRAMLLAERANLPQLMATMHALDVELASAARDGLVQPAAAQEEFLENE